MDIFDSVETNETKEAAPRTAFSNIQYATRKTQSLMQALDAFDTQIAKLAQPPEKGTVPNPDVQKKIDRLTQGREKLVAGMSTPQMMHLIGLSNIPNGQVFLKAIDPRTYAMLSPEQRFALQRKADELTAGKSFDAPAQGGQAKPLGELQ